MKRLLFYSSACLLMFLFFGCTHQGVGKLPKVKTGEIVVGNFSQRGVIASGLVNVNGSTVVKYGICYSTTDRNPDINGPHTNMADREDNYHYYGSDVLTGYQIQPVCGRIRTSQGTFPPNTTIYARAYAMTIDGEFVYGNTISCSTSGEGIPAVLLTRPNNGWKQVSPTSNDALVFNRDGSFIYTSYLGDAHGDWHIYGWPYEDFFSGNSEFFPPGYDTWLYYYAETEGTVYTVQAKILNLTTNELRIEREDGCVLTYVPAP